MCGGIPETTAFILVLGGDFQVVAFDIFTQQSTGDCQLRIAERKKIKRPINNEMAFTNTRGKIADSCKWKVITRSTHMS